MSTTAVASIILGIITIVLSVLLGKKSGQKDAISEKLEATQAQLNASKQETQLAVGRHKYCERKPVDRRAGSLSPAR